MTPAKEDTAAALSRSIIEALDNVSGLHSGFRPAHAKGILLSGTFTPAIGGQALTRAPHLQNASTPVTVRFSNFTGVPNIPDSDPNASPRGMAIRFHLAEHVHTDIVAHSVDGFPVRTAEEFVEFLGAIYLSGPTVPHPTPVEQFVGAHPAALEFVQTPKPVPASFAKECFYAVSAYRFISDKGAIRYGRYRIRPEGGTRYLDDAAAAAQSPDFLFDDIGERIGCGPVRMNISVQLAGTGDIVDNATIHWPQDRPSVEFGVIELNSVLLNNEAEQRQIIFDPIPRVDGIEPSEDPLLEPRANVYLMSGRRRRKG